MVRKHGRLERREDVLVGWYRLMNTNIVHSALSVTPAVISLCPFQGFITGCEHDTAFILQSSS